ncbi:FMN-binding protein [Kribbella solani]|uniref:Uncharacterized protein with FMN-binding domain n=1 Tax=Kribbella solani TaxID=236067 RepID=A0A841DJ04_9ACTN|nr:FMN-binding protein [Kribbella solani]MBB5977871.1 uncharacterized protein with FMN-binding domain [Kribbella solani]
MTSHSERLRRNLAVGGGTGVLLLLLFLYPTSTNRTEGQSTPAASAGVVSNSTGELVINGSSAGTRYGPVQVRITVRANRLIAVTPLVYPNGGRRDQEISTYALPQLTHEALAAQTAHIDTVSGATFTSDGYRRSLQSALDSAHLTS